jgi:putative nucleotidyltransferase with HDIG domain
MKTAALPNIETCPLNTPMTPFNILFVDDEKSLLDGMRRSLHRKHREWNIHYIDSGREALEFLENHPCDLIVSDMRMPEMSGDELLRHVREKHPNVIRFILTGFVERNVILECIGLAHQIFSKPCDPEALASAISFSNSLYHKLANERIQKVVCNVKNLPTLPQTYQALVKELQRKDCDIENLVGIIRNDSAVSTKVLQMVNSAYFGLDEPVADITQATMYLGVENLKSVVLAVEIAGECFKELRSRFDLDKYAIHAMRVGGLSEKFAKTLELKQKDTQCAFTSGLLHDIGKLVMLQHFDELYLSHETSAMSVPDTAHTEKRELEKFGVSHSELGASLVGIWGLPPMIVHAVAYHHHLDQLPQDQLLFPAIVHVANAVALKTPDQTLEDLYQCQLLDRGTIERMEWTALLEEFIDHSTKE